MANLNFDTNVTDWTTNSGSATAVPNSIPKTQFESMLTALTPQSDFFDRSIVCNASKTAASDFVVKTANTTTNLAGQTKGDYAFVVDSDNNKGVGIGGGAYTDYDLTCHGSVRIVGDQNATGTELYISDSYADAQLNITSTADAAQIYVIGLNGAHLELRDNSTTGYERINMTNDGGKFKISVIDMAATNPTTYPFEIDNATGNVGIGGAADTGNYELKVNGNQWILGDNSGTGTELRIEDTTATSQTGVYGDTGAYTHMSTETGSAQIAMIKGRTGTGQSSNALKFYNDGGNTKLELHDYNSSAWGSLQSTPIAINNATGNVGIKGAADTGNYDLKVNGQFRVDNSDGSTEAYIYSGTDTSIVHVKSGHTTGYGQLYLEGGGGAKIDMQDSNASQNNDRFTIMNAGDKVAFDIYDNTESKVHDVLDIDLATGSVVINETSQTGLDFRVESGGNANMLHVDGTNDQVGIGCDPSVEALGYQLVVHGSQ